MSSACSSSSTVSPENTERGSSSTMCRSLLECSSAFLNRSHSSPLALFASLMSAYRPRSFMPRSATWSLPLRDLLLGRALEVLDDAAVPRDHRARAVLLRWDHVLEVEVLDRMILGLHREDLLVGIQARAARHGEAREHAADLEPQIVVSPRRVVEVHDVRARERALGGGNGKLTAERLVRRLRAPLAAVIAELRSAPFFHDELRRNRSRALRFRSQQLRPVDHGTRARFTLECESGMRTRAALSENLRRIRDLLREGT